MRHSESERGNGIETQALSAATGNYTSLSLHPAWSCFLRFCEELRFGEIEKLRIQDGLPVTAEVTTKKVKFAP
jgi:hypothetical protein